MTVSGVLISSIVETVMWIAFFSLVPLILYMNKAGERTFKGFMSSVGLYKCLKTNRSSVILLLLIVSVVSFGITATVVLSGNSGRASGEMQDFTLVTYCIFLIFYGLRTGIGEELFFRGFVGKKLIGRLGFISGNGLQALIFGLAHIPFMGSNATTADLLAKVLVATLLGYALGYVTERKCDGSILPAMIAHGLYNIAASILLPVIYYFLL